MVLDLVTEFLEISPNRLYNSPLEMCAQQDLLYSYI